MSCDCAFGTCLQGTMRMRQPYNLVNSKRWIKQKEHKKANVDQELEPKKRPSMQRAQRLARRREQYKECRARAAAWAFLRLYSSCSAFSILFSSPSRPLLSLLGRSSWGLSYNSSQFAYTSILSAITESWWCGNARVLRKVKEHRLQQLKKAYNRLQLAVTLYCGESWRWYKPRSSNWGNPFGLN